MVSTARNAVAPSTDRRLAERPVFGRRGTLRVDGREPVEVIVGDLTRDGCRIETTIDLERNARASIGLANVGLTDCTIVWKSARGYGCVFDVPLTTGSVTAAFGPTNVAAFPGQANWSPRITVPVKWSARARAMLLVAAATGAWSGIGLAVMLAVG